MASRASRGSFDEISAQVTPRRQPFLGQLLVHLACQHGDGAEAMLALRSVLLNDRWDDVWATFRPKPKLA